MDGSITAVKIRKRMPARIFMSNTFGPCDVDDCETVVCTFSPSLITAVHWTGRVRCGNWDEVEKAHRSVVFGIFFP